MQGVDAVFTIASLVLSLVIVRLTDILVTQITHTVPTEVITFANRQCLFEMVLIHVLRQDQSPDLTTTGRCIREFELIRTRSGVLCGLFLTCRSVSPCVLILSQCRSRLVNTLRMLVDDDLHQRVATQVVEEVTALVVYFAVETYTLVVADREGRVDMLYFTNRQV